MWRRWLAHNRSGHLVLPGLLVLVPVILLAGLLSAALPGGQDAPNEAQNAKAAPEVTLAPRVDNEERGEGPAPESPASLEVEHQAAAGPQGDDQGEAIVMVAPARDVPPPVRRVGVQAGHWRSAELPDELGRLRGSTGTSGGGVAEWQLNLDIARRVASLLEAEGLEVDLLPATIPPGYQADAFVALHADGDVTGGMSGFKLAAPRVSAIADLDEALLVAIREEYQAATRLRLDYSVSRNMTGYYAFTFRRFKHAIAPTTPAVILEMGFLTNASDRLTLLGKPDLVAEGIARGILRFIKLRDGP
ncbi:MAG: N-acetylmuramoyl-L-alanine amidase [Chloroflexi bacterium]|nr:N-acetylmuramoyl-L-alanine amidase [Chloroflexota bacterium]